MQATKQDNKIQITFTYKPELVQLVKSLSGREYDPKSRNWFIPIAGSLSAVKRLANNGFFISQDVIQAVKEDKRLADEAEALVVMPDTEFDTQLPLYPYQKIGASFLYKLGSGLLGDEPGMGKTLMSLAVAEKAKAEKVLIFTPSAVKWQFAEEIKRFIPGSSVVVVNGSVDKRRELWTSKARFYIANYELLLRDMDHINTRDWDLLIADEATKISNYFAKQSRAIKKLRAKRRIAMTGTPISNKANDLYNIIDFISPGAMGNYFGFISRYCLKNQWGSVFAYQNMDELRTKLKRYMIRRTRAEVLPELPEKIETDIPFDLSEEETALYNKIRKEILFDIKKEDINKLENPMTIQYTLTKLLRLQQLTNSMELLGDSTKSTKIEVLKELLDERTETDKCLIYTKFSQFADILERELKDYKPLKITGDVKDRQPIIDTFNNKEDNRVMIITDAASYGLNFQFKCSTVICMDLPFSLAKLEQVVGRVYRIGQKNTVWFYSLLGRKTVDYHLKKILEGKKKVSDQVLTFNDIQQMLNYD